MGIAHGVAAGIGVVVLAATRLAAAAPVVVFDFEVEDAPRAAAVSDDELRILLASFPAPRAAPGSACSVQPRVTAVTGALVAGGHAPQTAYLFDYCPTGSGQARARRLVVVAGTTAVIDRILPAVVPADEVLAAVDIDGDGIAELVLVGDTMHGSRVRETAYVVQPSPRAVNLLGAWTAWETCVPGQYNEEQIGHRVTATGGHGGARLVFHETSQVRACFYRPAPP